MKGHLRSHKLTFIKVLLTIDVFLFWGSLFHALTTVGNTDSIDVTFVLKKPGSRM